MNKLSRRSGCLLVMVFSLLAAGPSPAKAEGPNIVLIMADDLGYGDLCCYDVTKIATPHCDELARQGRRFTDAHTPSAICSPTRYGLLTGNYPWCGNRVPRHLLASEPLVIRPGQHTIATLLKRAGSSPDVSANSIWAYRTPPRSTGTGRRGRVPTTWGLTSISVSSTVTTRHRSFGSITTEL